MQMLKRLGIAFAFVAIAVGYAFADDDKRTETIERATNNSIDACFIRWNVPTSLGVDQQFAACVRLVLREREIAIKVLSEKY